MPACSAFFTGRRLGSPGARQPRAGARRQVVVEAKGKKVMIVNTKKGGHAFLGLYLAKRLLGKGLGVTIFNDGDPVRPTSLHSWLYATNIASHHRFALLYELTVSHSSF